MSVVINNNVSLNQYSFSASKVSDTNYDVLCNGSPFILEIAPTSKQLYDGHEAYGLKKATGKAPLVSIKLSEEDTKPTYDLLKAIQNAVEASTGQKVENLIYEPDSGKTPTFSTRCKYFKERNVVQTDFRYSKNKRILDPCEELYYSFRAVYYISFSTVIQAKNGKWYINTTLERCIVYKRKFMNLGLEYL